MRKTVLKHLVRGFVHRIFGVALNGFGNGEGKKYQSVIPAATYSPWNLDPEFIRCYRAIEPFTLVDKYRCYELWSLVGQVAGLDGALLEVGTWRGGSGALISLRAQQLNPESRVFLCDTFSGMVKTGPSDSYYRGGEHADTSKETVARFIHEKLELSNTKIVQGIFPEETGHVLEDLMFKFCHIDVDVYASAKDIFDWLWPRLIPGGMVVYDDYGFAYCDGVQMHVNEVKDRSDCIFFHNLNGHAVMVKRG